MANTFSNFAIKGLTKVGNIYCPKNGEFPAFSEVAGTYKLNDLVRNVPSDDFSSLNLVLAIFAFLPNFQNASNHRQTQAMELYLLL